MKPAIAVAQPFTFKPPEAETYDPYTLIAKTLIPTKDFDLTAERRKFQDRYRAVSDQRARTDRQLQALNRFIKWAEGSPNKLERPETMAWSQLREARGINNVMPVMRAWAAGDLEPFFSEEPQVFLVEHDWGTAFAGASDFQEGEYPLPFERTAFEFQISGMRIVVLCTKANDGFHDSVICYDGGNGAWLSSQVGTLVKAPEPDRDQLYAAHKIIRDTVRGLCIALDSGVAVHDVVRGASTGRGNRQEAPTPRNDYHVVSLARRSRAAPLETAEGNSHRVRLHFRRGHWRHFATHKTWIKWMLVGDPDLGFIDKHYRA